MLRLSVNLYADERQALIRLAHGERRNPRDQAAVIIRNELERRGLLPNDTAQQVQANSAEVSRDRN